MLNNASEIMELQKLAGMENFKILTIPQYLEREKLIRLLQCSPTDIMGNRGVGALADHLIANDVASVVRCKDCKYSRQTKWYRSSLKCCHPSHGCSQVPYEVPQYHFCSYGERREGE